MDPLKKISELEAERAELKKALAVPERYAGEWHDIRRNVDSVGAEIAMWGARLPQVGDPITWETFYNRRADIVQAALYGAGAWVWARTMGFAPFQQRWSAGAAAMFASLTKRNSNSK